MQKRPVKAITYFEFESHVRHGSRPPGQPESALDRLFTSLARATGLTTRARRSLVARIEALDTLVRETANEIESQRIQYLHNLHNKVVDGGWVGLWTSLRICCGMA